MTPILSAAEYVARVEPNAVPQNASEKPDTARIDMALQEATGIIVMHCPFLLGEDGSDVALPLPPQFGEGLRAVCLDLARHRLADTLRDSEEARLSYRESIRMLERINEQQQRTLASPTEATAELLDPLGKVSNSILGEFFGPPARGMW